MTKSEITTQIGYRYRSASRNFITDDEILSELNRSIDRLNGKLDLAGTIVETTFSFTGDGTYTFASLGITDFKRPISLYDRTNNIGYKRVSLSSLREQEDSGNAIYSIKGTNLVIESGVGSATLTLIYYSTNDCFNSGGTLRKGLSASTDYPALQTRFHDYFVEDTAAVLFRKEKKFDDYKIAKEEAKEIFSEILDENPTQEEKIVSLITPYGETY